MQTHFTLAQLADPDIAVANDILRSCVHCGFCNATCPTYVLRGDELDSPRGRIMLIKDMLEGDKPASRTVAHHIGRCLSCLSCMSTCPSDVNYMHLVDQARARIEETFKRPISERVLRGVLALVLARPRLFWLAVKAAGPVRWVARVLPGRMRSMIDLMPKKVWWPSLQPQIFKSDGKRRGRVALLSGCVQPALAPVINDATIRLLNRHGIEVVVPRGAGCCGALAHHLGRTAPSHRSIKANLDAWWLEMIEGGLDAIVVNASGCGTMVKDYGFIMRDDEDYAEKGASLSAMTRDVTEYLTEIGPIEATELPEFTVAYQSACSMQHGQKLHKGPMSLLRRLGFDVREPTEGHLCCGSAGTYNILQPELAGQLRARTAACLEATGADLIASGNIGCMTQLNGFVGMPIVHTVELLDWATGGPRPPALAFMAAECDAQ